MIIKLYPEWHSSLVIIELLILHLSAIQTLRELVIPRDLVYVVEQYCNIKLSGKATCMLHRVQGSLDVSVCWLQHLHWCGRWYTMHLASQLVEQCICMWYHTTSLLYIFIRRTCFIACEGFTIFTALKAAIMMLTFMYIMSMVDALHALLCILNTWSTECFVFQLIMCCVLLQRQRHTL